MQHRDSRKGRYQATTLIAVVVLLLIMFTSAAYFFLIPVQTDETSPTDLFAMKLSTWESQQPPGFRYVVQRSCDCPQELSAAYVATEIGGSRSAAFPVTVESAAGEFLGEPPQAVYIADIFEELAEALERPHLVEVNYNARFGYPDSVQIVYPGSTPDIRYDIRDFEVLEHRQ